MNTQTLSRRLTSTLRGWQKTMLSTMLMLTASIAAQATVTITAPERPSWLDEDEELQAGQEYYLYNVGAGRFMNRNTSSTSYCGWSNTPYAFRLDESSEGFYAFWQGNGYIGDDSYVYWNQSTSNTNSYVRYDLQKTETGLYTIKYVYRDTYIGYSSSNSSYVYYSTSGANAEWVIVPANESTTQEEAQNYVEVRMRYKRKLELYNAIINVAKYDIEIEPYEAIYNDETKTSSDFLTTTNKLNSTISLSEEYSGLTSWSDYPILITDIGSWEKNGSGLSKRSESNKGYDTTNTFEASVYVDEPSTLYFHLFCDQSSQYEPMMPFQVFIDGELVYDYKGETNRYYFDTYLNYRHGQYTDSSYSVYGSNYGYNSNYWYSKNINGYYSTVYDNLISRNDYFIDINPGHHQITIINTQKYNSNSSFNTYLSNFAVKKTPTIEVNVAKEGSLGKEVLKAMDNHPLISESHVRNVRRLKISGNMGDEDWQELYNMPYLYSLDLTDANITELKTQCLSSYTHSSLGYLHEVKLPKKLQKIGREALFGLYIDDTDIPESVTSIGDYAFFATRIREANIPNVTTIGHNAFRGCTMLNRVVMKNVESMGINTFAECYNITDITFDGTLTTIPQRAFNACSEIENIILPETVAKIETAAFYSNGKSKLSKLPDALQTVESSAFYNNKKATFTLPIGLKTIGGSAFHNCYNLSGDIPNTVTSIGSSAFYGCRNINGTIPASVTSVGESAFNYAFLNTDSVTLSPNASYGKGAFQYAKMKHVTIPENLINITTQSLFANCDSLQSIKLMASTMTTVPSDFVSGLSKKSLRVQVPEHLLYTYRRDSYWMDFTIEGFSTEELDSVVIRQSLSLDYDERLEGSPSIALLSGKTFEIVGAAGMEVNNFSYESDLKNNRYAQLWTSNDNVNINGDCVNRIYTAANKWNFMSLPFDCDLKRTTTENGCRYAIRYYDGAGRAAEVNYAYPESAHNYANSMTKDTEGNLQTLSYPGAKTLKLIFSSSTATEGGCDYIHILDASGVDHTYNGNIGAQELTIEGDHFDIWITSDGSSVRYGYSFSAIYADDVLLKNINLGFNWKNYDCSKDIIPAGTGFIFMTSQDAWTNFYAVKNATRNRVFESPENENNELHIPLQKHPSENAANRGWNLVGNPYPNYYNIHRISFAAPITLWNGTTYQAYSLSDDDIAIKPNQAIFVQCPEERDEISFPAAGRQLTSVITDQANLPARRDAAAVRDRQVINLALVQGNADADNENSDRTRIVLNESASQAYELACDASKFMSMDNQMHQLYTLGRDGVKYAINERPAADGQVALGIYVPTDGTYTLQLLRNDAETILLTDAETGLTTDLTSSDYTFTAKAGTYDHRFILSVQPKQAAEETAIEGLASEHNGNGIYTIDGRRASNMQRPGTYIQRNGNTVRKVLVK